MSGSTWLGEKGAASAQDPHRSREWLLVRARLGGETVEAGRMVAEGLMGWIRTEESGW